MSDQGRVQTLHDGEHDDHIKHPHYGDRCMVEGNDWRGTGRTQTCPECGREPRPGVDNDPHAPRCASCGMRTEGRSRTVVVPRDKALTVALRYCQSVCDKREHGHDWSCILSEIESADASKPVWETTCDCLGITTPTSKCGFCKTTADASE